MLSDDRPAAWKTVFSRGSVLRVTRRKRSQERCEVWCCGSSFISRAQRVTETFGAYVACLVSQPVLLVVLIHPIILQARWRRVIVSARVMRIRQYGLRIRGVVIAIFDPSVSGKNIIPYPSGRRSSRRRKPQSHLIAGVHDDVSIIRGGQQRSHIAEPRVKARKIPPDLGRACQIIVVRDLRRGRIRLVNG